MVGKQISELRRQKGVTQETLAQAVGVTPQAVSKWEVGGTPDIELLPVIADYFGVSVDKLFDRKTIDSENIESAITKYISETPDEHRFEKVFDLCWVMQRSLCGNDTLDEHDSINAVRNRESGYSYSQMLNNFGITNMALSEHLPYFMMMPEPEDGWLKEFGNIEQYTSLFKLLSNEDVIKTLYFLYQRENKPFTPKLLEKNLQIPQERAKEILTSCIDTKLISTTEIELDDEIQTVYNFNANPAFIPFLAISKEMISKPGSFTWYCQSRKVPYFKNK